MQFGFYVLGARALHVLKSFLDKEGAARVAWVVVGQDSGVDDDHHDDIVALCETHGVPHWDRLAAPAVLPDFSLQFSIGWRWLIPAYQNLVVFHDSLLPRYRGFAPLVNALINGEPRVGVTAIRAGVAYDEGDILGQQSLDLHYPVTIAQAIHATAVLYEELVLDVVRRYRASGSLQGHPQDASQVTYSMWRDEHDYRIDWRQSSDQIRRLIDAVGAPYAGACTEVAGRRVRILRAEPVSDVQVECRADHVGKVIFKLLDQPVVVCGHGLLRLIEVIEDDSRAPASLQFRSRLQ